ncbi:MAG: STAS domain-containing protein [Candidatus Latescibacteria bacterium]|nr:STAS domain-containing protein [Candidatus Latescibacterota bacterium]
MSLEVRTVGDVTVLTPKGMLLGGKETDELQGKIKELAEAGNKKLLINLGQTTFMNSVSLGVLIAGHSNYAKRSARMKLCAVDKKIQNIFVVTKLSLVFDVYDSEDEALKSFA